MRAWILSLMLTATASASPNAYVNDVDVLLTIHHVAVLPAADNVQGIYGASVTQVQKDFFNQSHRFILTELKNVDGSLTADSYEQRPDVLKQMHNEQPVDAFVLSQISKQLDRVTVRTDLFLGVDGLLLLQETGSIPSGYTTSDVQNLAKSQLEHLMSRLPYRGLILSRHGQDVTMDVGSKDGLRAGMVAMVDQFISLRRHPQFHFMVSADKELLGQVLITKAEPTLSFGRVLRERDVGVIQPDTKVVEFQDSAQAPLPFELRQQINKPTTPTNPIIYGAHPSEWKPAPTPRLGKLGLSLGLGSAQISKQLQTAGTQSASAPVIPEFKMDGELWITPGWFGDIRLREAIGSISNPQSGSQPGSLNLQLSTYDILTGYRLTFDNDVLGPRLDAYLGYGWLNMFTDASTPLTFTSTLFRGLFIGVAAGLPVTDDRSVSVDVHLEKFFNPGLVETPETSGSSYAASYTRFGFGGSYALTPSFKLRGDLLFDLLNTSFTGQGSSSDPSNQLTQNLFTLFAGMEYWF